MSLDSYSERDSEQGYELSDPREMRALTHPLRLALIELLWREGSVNATQAASELRESQASCSFHLRQLAKFGFVEEVEGVRGRARPWRLSRRGIRVANVQDDPQAAIAWAGLERLLNDRQLDRYRAWLEGRSAYPREWQESAYHSHSIAWVTPAELRELADEISRLIASVFPERRDDRAARPADALPVELLSIGYPIPAGED